MACRAAARLRDFALPVLHGLDSVAAVAAAYASSPIFDAGDGYAALLSAEMSNDARLGALPDEIERRLRKLDRDPTKLETGSLSLIERIRQRVGVPAASQSSP